LFYAIKHALRGINRRKLKNLINTIGILIGVSLLAGVQIATDSLVNAMKDTVNLRYGNADIIIQRGEYTTTFFNNSVYEQLRDDPLLAPHIDGIAPRITSQVSVTSFSSTKQTEPIVTVIGINQTLDQPFGTLKPDPSYANNDFDFQSLGSIDCIIGDSLADSVIETKELGAGGGIDTIDMYFVSADDVFAKQVLAISGVAKPEGKGLLRSRNTIFMKLHYLQTIFNATNEEINNIVVSTTQSNTNAAFVKELLEERLLFYLGEEASAFKVDAQKLDAYSDVESTISDFRVVLYVFGTLIIISGVMLIINISLMNIDERQRSIGIMRAIGMTRMQLATSLITESVIVGGIGSVLGLGAGALNGLGIIALLENFLGISRILTSIPLIVNPIGLIISFVIGMVISLLAAIYPAWRASRLDIVETINEIETPSRKKTSGDWSLYVGLVMFAASLAGIIVSLFLLTEWRWVILMGGLFLFLFGVGFFLSRFIKTRLAFNIFSLSWMISGIVLVLTFIPFLDQRGVEQRISLYSFLIAMLGLVFGTIIFVALNLEWISNRFNDFFQQFKSTRAIGVISMRYVGKKKTRSALTFAIFGVILTMNIFLAVFTGSFTLGFDDFATREEGGVNIIAYSPFGAGFNISNPLQTIKDADPNVEKAIGMKFKFSLSGAVTYLDFTYFNQSVPETETLPIPTDMWGISDEFLDMTEYAISDKWDQIEGDPWVAAQNSSKKYVILPAALTEYGFDEFGIVYDINVTLGETIGVPEINPVTSEEVIANYTVIAFVETTSYSVLISNFLFTSPDSPIFNSTTNRSAFLISTREGLSTEELVEVGRNVEAELLGFDTLVIRNRIEQVLDIVNQMVNFMQAFISLGLVVGVFGLIIVALRGITERTREIGMMRALGYQRSEVITAVVMEIFAVAFVGLIIGMINGFILGYGMYSQYLVDFDFRFIIPWAMIGIFIAATTVLSVIAAVLPARKAAKIPPSEALRYTG
jgi:ABC-type antimicrobial peptide transport system permease subunit